MTDPEDAGHLFLSAPADPTILDLVHSMIDQLWTGNPGVSEADRVRFEMGVIEILGNIVEHAFRLDSPDGTSTPAAARRLEVTLTADDGQLLATLADNGLPMGLDLSEVTMPDELAEHGRGLALATAAADDLAYERVGSRNQWRLRCVRRPDGS